MRLSGLPTVCESKAPIIQNVLLDQGGGGIGPHGSFCLKECKNSAPPPLPAVQCGCTATCNDCTALAPASLAREAGSVQK